VAHPELLCGVAHVDRAPLEREAGIASDHSQTSQLRQRRKNVVDQAVAKIFLLRIAAHVLERQHRDRGLVGQREARGFWRRGGFRRSSDPDLQRVSPHRLGDVLEMRRAEIGHREIQPRFDLPIGLF
jgi:hypothetical protein